MARAKITSGDLSGTEFEISEETLKNIKKTKSEERLRTHIYKVSKKRLEELNTSRRKKRHAKPRER